MQSTENHMLMPFVSLNKSHCKSSDSKSDSQPNDAIANGSTTMDIVVVSDSDSASEDSIMKKANCFLIGVESKQEKSDPAATSHQTNKKTKVTQSENVRKSTENQSKIQSTKKNKKKKMKISTSLFQRSLSAAGKGFSSSNDPFEEDTQNQPVTSQSPSETQKSNHSDDQYKNTLLFPNKSSQFSGEKTKSPEFNSQIENDKFSEHNSSQHTLLDLAVEHSPHNDEPVVLLTDVISTLNTTQLKQLHVLDSPFITLEYSPPPQGRETVSEPSIESINQVQDTGDNDSFQTSHMSSKITTSDTFDLVNSSIPIEERTKQVSSTSERKRRLKKKADLRSEKLTKKRKVESENDLTDETLHFDQSMVKEMRNTSFVLLSKEGERKHSSPQRDENMTENHSKVVDAAEKRCEDASWKTSVAPRVMESTSSSEQMEFQKKKLTIIKRRKRKVLLSKVPANTSSVTMSEPEQARKSEVDPRSEPIIGFKKKKKKLLPSSVQASLSSVSTSGHEKKRNSEVDPKRKSIGLKKKKILPSSVQASLSSVSTSEPEQERKSEVDPKRKSTGIKKKKILPSSVQASLSSVSMSGPEKERNSEVDPKHKSIGLKKKKIPPSSVQASLSSVSTSELEQERKSEVDPKRKKKKILPSSVQASLSSVSTSGPEKERNSEVDPKRKSTGIKKKKILPSSGQTSSSSLSMNQSDHAGKSEDELKRKPADFKRKKQNVLPSRVGANPALSMVGDMRAPAQKQKKKKHKEPSSSFETSSSSTSLSEEVRKAMDSEKRKPFDLRRKKSKLRLSSSDTMSPQGKGPALSPRYSPSVYPVKLRKRKPVHYADSEPRFSPIRYKKSGKKFRHICLMEHRNFNEVVIAVEGATTKHVDSRLSKNYNFLFTKTLRELIGAFQISRKSKHCKAVVISSVGPVFCSGLDPVSLLNWTSEQADTWDIIELMKCFVNILIKFSKPVIAVVQGPAVGFGATILLHCDCVYASDRVSLQWPFAQIGMPPFGCTTQILNKTVGLCKTRSLLLEGRIITAKAAKDLGIITEVFPHDTLLANAKPSYSTILKSPDFALLQTKVLININHVKSLVECNSCEIVHLKHCLQSPSCLNHLQQYIIEHLCRDY